MYAITGATGNIGKVIANTLLDAGKKVRVLSRSSDKVKELEEKGAEVFIGEVDDVDFLTRAFEGTTAIFAMIPPNLFADSFRGFQNKVTDAQVEAAKKSGVKNIVTLSSVGAHLPERAGVVQGLYDMEQKWNKVEGINVVHLRASYFMENTLGQIDVIKNMGIMGAPVEPDLKISMVATKDIAEAASKRLLNLDFNGKDFRYVLGPEEVTYPQVASVYAKALGRDELEFVKFSYDDFRNVIINNWGGSESAADAYVEFSKSLNDGKIFEDAKLNESNKSTTSIEDFSKTFAYIYNL